MKTMLRLKLIIIALSLSACASVPESLVTAPEVSLSNVEVVGLGFKSQTFLLSFDVVNPNPFPLPVSNINYGVKLDGQRFASGETLSDLRIPAEGSSQFAISVDLDLLNTAPQLLAIVREGGRRDIPYQLVGRLGVDIPLAPALKYRNEGTIRMRSDSLLSTVTRATNK
jgi:LEA14-like dessication related protein